MYSFSGVVVDVNTNKPIGDVEVQIDEYPTVYTNADGRFEIKTEKIIQKPEIVDATKKGFKIMGWGKLPDQKGIKILMKPEQIYFTGKITDHKSLIVPGAEVILEGFNDTKPVKTNQQGYFELYLPLDYKLSSSIVLIVNKQKFTGEELNYDDAHKSVSIQLADPYPPVEVSIAVKFTDKKPASHFTIICDGKELITDHSGKAIAMLSESKLSNIENYIRLAHHSKEKIFSVKQVGSRQAEVLIETPPTNYTFVPPTASNPNEASSLSQVEEDTSLSVEVAETKKDIENIIQELEQEKNMLLNNSRRLSDEIKRISMRITADKSLSEKEKNELSTYLARLEAKFLANEKAYLEAQERTKQIILQMRLALEEKDSLHKEEIASIEEQVRMLEEEKEREAAAIRKKLFWAIGIGILVAGLALLSYSVAMRIKKQKNELQVINEKLSITTKNLEEALEDLRFKNQKITDSIRYAKTIQEAILPSTKLFSSCFEEHFVFFRPKDYVSGDFYWLAKSDDFVYLAVVDCTGHGVPGAFMSMIGNSFLNEIIIQKKINNPAEILHQLDIGLKQALKQDEKLNSDGMDIALCRFQTLPDSYTHLVFSGAKRNIFVRKRHEAKVEMLKGNRIAIGGAKKRTDSFSTAEYSLQKGDMVYLITDGYTDQFSDETQQKFGTSRLIELLNKIANLPAYEQRDILIHELEVHQKQSEQRDDITVVGVRI